MSLAKRNNQVEKLSAHRADQPLAVGIRLRGSHWTLDLTKRGVNTSVARNAQVHDVRKQGIVTYAVAVAREKGKSRVLGWPSKIIMRGNPSMDI